MMEILFLNGIWMESLDTKLLIFNCLTSYITKGALVEDVAKLLTFGVICQLKNWWNTIVTNQDRMNILHHQL